MARELQRAHLLIRGVVQGVWFRASMRTEGLRLGIQGWVRNVPNGSVEAVVEGPREQVDRLIAWAHEGPEHAAVESVEVDWIERDDVLDSFEVRR